VGHFQHRSILGEWDVKEPSRDVSALDRPDEYRSYEDPRKVAPLIPIVSRFRWCGEKDRQALEVPTNLLTRQFSQEIFYIQHGGVKLSVLKCRWQGSRRGHSCSRRLFGEGCLAGQGVRKGSATAITPTTLLVIEKQEMSRVLHAEHAFSDRFLSHMLARNIRIEEDLIDQLFNSSEKRLARTLLLLAHYGQNKTTKVIGKVTQQTLAEIIGTTRSRVNVFMNKFKRLGFITDRGDITVKPSLLSVLLRD
jgi:CRP/FNR family transcriptional regulator, cyclic AMP receptor protein